jgi:Carboxypeptidase regulatory-like domain
MTDAADDFSDAARNWQQLDLSTLEPGQVGGVIIDANGAVVAGAEVNVTNTQTGASLTTTSDEEGHWRIAGMQPGATKVAITASGFKKTVYDLDLQASKPARLGTTLEVASINETVNVTADGADVNSRQIEDMLKKKQATQLYSLSANAINLQRRVAGVLPVPIEVPRSGRSYRFVRPLVMEEETRITFQYKSR